jgi:hypothetical protein
MPGSCELALLDEIEEQARIKRAIPRNILNGKCVGR